MIETGNPEINVDELMEKIREEVRRRKEGSRVPSRTVPRATHAPLSPPYAGLDFSMISRIGEPEPFQPKDKGYHISDFLKYHDHQFVINAYRGIIRREPDSEGLTHFLSHLRSGKMTKAVILGRLRYSPEGRATNVKINGLFWNFIIQSSFAIPILGYVSRLGTGIVNLPTVIRNMQILEAGTFTLAQQQTHELVAALGNLGPVLDHKAERDDLGSLRGELGELESVLDRKVERDDLGSLKSEFEAILDRKADKEQIALVNDQIFDILRQTRDHKLNIIDQQRRLKLLLEEARKRLPEPFANEQLTEMAKEKDHLLDAAYVSFEDLFRGTREDIKVRLKVYLPFIRESGVGTEDAPIIDVGCGRGEWLELLKEEGLKARGVDSNRVLVDECLDRGLEVFEAEAIKHLRTVADRCLGAVTGFHLIEHLPLKMQIDLMDEAMRVLRSGGIAIFETPNPQNLLVGACDFYKDPTHARPLHPDAQRMLMEYRGFSRVEVLYSNPPDKYHRFPLDDAPKLADRLNDLIFCARDYAVIGYKV